MNKIKNALILAGGDGNRLWPLSEKNLISFLGKPLIVHLVQNIKEYVESITLVVNDTNKEKFETFLRECKIDTQVRVLVQTDIEKGQAGAITAASELKGPTLILNANDVFDLTILNKYDQEKDVIILAKEMATYFPGGYIKLEGNRPIEIVEKPDPDKVPSNKVGLVCYYLRTFEDLVNAISKVTTIQDDVFEQALNILLKEKSNTDCVLLPGAWSTIKFPWHVLSVQEMLLTTIPSPDTNNALISSSAIVSGNVHFGKNVKVGDFAKISGPCYIGDNTIVGDYALVRNSHIGKNCLIGGYTEVARSYIGNNVSLHRNYVGDSVLADNVLMGSGATTANYRFDGKNVLSVVKEKKVDSNLSKFGAIIGTGSKIGVNSTILPGIKIGKNTFVGPHTLINHDIEDNMFLFNGSKIPNKNK